MKTSILSFGKLMRWVAQQHQEKGVDFLVALRDGVSLNNYHSCREAERCKIALVANGRGGMTFQITTPKCVRGSCYQIGGLYRQGKLMSQYYASIMPSTFNEPWLAKFWPFHLPDGCGSRAGKGPRIRKAVLRDTDGKTVKTLDWHSGKRGRSGSFGLGRHMILCDTDRGKLEDFTNYDQAGNCNIETRLRWFPLACSEQEFFYSLATLPNQFADCHLMTSLAERAVQAAKRMASMKPGAKVFLFPLVMGAHNPGLMPYASRTGESIDVWAGSGETASYRVPRVLVQWNEDWSEYGNYITMSIPPIGNTSLDWEDPDVRTRSPLQSGTSRSYCKFLACDPEKGSPSWSTITSRYGYTNYLDEEKLLFNFGRSNDHVICEYDGDGDLYDFAEIPVAYRPEAFANLVAEAALIKSLPLA